MRNLFFLLMLLLQINISSAQSVGIGTNTPSPSAILDLTSTNQGFLVPRMTASQRLAITPVHGLLVYDLDSLSLFICQFTTWKKVQVKKLEDLIVGSNFGDLLRWNGSTSWEPFSPPVPVYYPLTVARNGAGTITSDVAGVYCGLDCAESYTSGTIVTLTATAASGGTFLGWSGGVCSGTGACVVTMSAARNVIATFTNPLTVGKSGTGSGTVTSSPAGINCGATCGANYSNGSSVTLTATPDASSTFAGWSGACSGTGSCNVIMDDIKNVTAFFTQTQYLLAVTKNGSGDGNITSSPAGISCIPSCANTFTAGTIVTLTATPDANSTFTGWSGSGCSGTGTCVVTMDALKNITATFTKPQYTVTTTRTGPGTIISSPSGILCSPDCSETFASGTSLTLTAVPDAGASFGEWSGDCSGTGACNFIVNSNKNVNARFGYLLTVNKTGVGSGTVTGSPGGIVCGATCTYVHNPGTTVTLTATPSGGSTFMGWSGGGCSGTGTCVVTMNSAQTVTATFQ